MTAGVSAGTIYGGLMAEHLAVAYALIGAAIILVCFAFVLLNPEPKTPLQPPTPFRFGAFLRSFWVDPRAHPDFGWAFLGRFTIYMGYTAVLTYPAMQKNFSGNPPLSGFTSIVSTFSERGPGAVGALHARPRSASTYALRTRLA